MADDVQPSAPSWLQKHAAEFLEPQVDTQADALKSFAARQAAISEKLWNGRPTRLYSNTDPGDGDLGGGKVYDYHGMNPHSAARMLDRIHTRRDLTAAGSSELRTVAQSFDMPDAVDATGGVRSADSTPESAPDVVLPSSALIVDPGAFMPMDNDGYRDDEAAKGTVPNSNYVPKPATSTPDPKPATNNNPQDQASTNQGQPANNTTTPAPLLEKPTMPVAQPVAAPVEGVPWDTPTDNGGVATSVIVPGYGGQTIDTTVHNADGTVTQVRSVRDPESGGVTTWTANADGSLSVRYPDGTNGAEPGKAKIYTVPAGQNPSGAAPIRTDITANSKSADTTSLNPDGSESAAHSETLGNGNVATDYRNPDKSTSSTLSSPGDHGQVIATPTGYVDGNGYGWRIDKQGKRWDISPTANGNIAENMIGPKGNNVASREYGPNGELLAAWDSETGETMSTMSLVEAQAKAKNDFDRYLASRWMSSAVRDHSDLKDDKEITARAERLAALNSITAGPSTPIRITVDRAGKFLFAGVTGSDLVEHMTAPGENLGSPFKFDVHPDGKITDPDGNRLVKVNDSIVRVDPSGKVIIPENALAGRPGIGWRNPSGDSLEEGFTDGSIDKRIATSRFVFRPDEGKYREIAEVPAPGGVPGTKFYKVQGGGVLFEDVSGLHWATDPGQVPSLSERLKGVAIDTALLAAGEGFGYLLGRAASRIYSAYSARNGGSGITGAAEAVDAGAAGRQVPVTGPSSARPTGGAHGDQPIELQPARGGQSSVGAVESEMTVVVENRALNPGNAGRVPNDPPAGSPSPVIGVGASVDGVGAPGVLAKLDSGASRGVEPTPESIRHGTVRMEDHPSFEAVKLELERLGYPLRVTDDLSKNPHVVRAEIVDGKKDFIRIDQYVQGVSGMRYLDLEHELGHVDQILYRFGDNLPLTARIKEVPNKPPNEMRHAPGIMTSRQDAIMEFHNRLKEYLWLSSRGTPREILDEHAAGVEIWWGYYQKAVKVHPGSRGLNRAWADEYFPDMDYLMYMYQKSGRTLKDGNK